MDREESWRLIEQERRSLADLLASLSDAEWDRPSLCGGWRVRDVAAHVALAAHPPGTLTALTAATRAGFRFHRLNHDIAVRYAESGTDLVAVLREHAASRRLPVVTNYRNIVADILVHGQDIAVPLGRPRPMPTPAAGAAATRVWTMGWPFWARRRLSGLWLSATDAEWTVGMGPAVRGPIAALLLALTGRPAAMSHLTGDGAGELARRLDE